MSKNLIVDLHIDPIIQHFLLGYEIQNKHNSNWLPQKNRTLYKLLKKYAHYKNLNSAFFNHVDLPRLEAAGYSCAGFGIHYWPVQSERGWQHIQKQLKYLHDVADHSPTFKIASSPQDVIDSHQTKALTGFPAVEGAHCLGRGGRNTFDLRLNRIDHLKKQKVASLTLTHFSSNDAACSSMNIRANKSGLSGFGRILIEKMNDVGIIVDVAHVNNAGVLGACQVSRKPVIVSHAGVRGIHNHWRNISNEALDAIAGTGGIVGIMFATNFLSGDTINPTSKIIIEHIDYIVQRIGEDHAAIGSDFDGWIPRLPEDMNDVKDFSKIIDGMRRIGYSERRIAKILGENFLRVWKENPA